MRLHLFKSTYINGKFRTIISSCVTLIEVKNSWNFNFLWENDKFERLNDIIEAHV